jgi:hypothetical protein
MKLVGIFILKKEAACSFETLMTYQIILHFKYQCVMLVQNKFLTYFPSNFKKWVNLYVTISNTEFISNYWINALLFLFLMFFV